MSDEPEKSKTKKAVREAGHSENVAALSSLLSTPKIEEMAPEERQRHIEAAKLRSPGEITPNSADFAGQISIRQVIQAGKESVHGPATGRREVGRRRQR